MKHLLVLALISTLASSPLFTQVPDSTFGVPGSFVGSEFPFPAITGCDFEGREDRCFSSLFLPTGKIILAGYSQGSDGTDFALVRLLQNGTFDSLAGPEGQMRIDLGYPNDSCLAAALYETDRIVMGGCVTLPGQEGYTILVARVDVDGQLDTTFGAKGQLAINLPTNNEMVTKILSLPDGKILIAGNAFYGTSFDFPDSTTVFVGRLQANGQIDSTFGTNGFIYPRYEYTCKSSLLGEILLDKNSRIILSGGSYSPYPGSYNIDDMCTHNIHICRYLPDGQADPSFGNNGVQELPFTEGRANALHVDEDGKIIVAGVISDLALTFPSYTFISRLLPNGSPDSSFAKNGRFVKFILGVSSSTEPIDILNINGCYYVGSVDEANGDHFWFGVIRFKENGAVDSTFGKNGVYSSLFWLPATLYNINQIHTIDAQSIYFSGYYSKLSQDNMIIAKIKVNKATSSIPTAPEYGPGIRLFPNPAHTEQVYIEYQDVPSEGPVAVQVFDLQGRVVASPALFLSGGLHTLDLSGLPNGMYIVSFTGRRVRQVCKFILQRQ